MENDLELKIKKLHLYLLEILKEIDRVCNKNCIKYTLIGGTLLGAIRHHGFIPWDDDADIGIPREQFETFINEMKNQMDKKFYIDICYLDKNNFLPFVKIKYKGTLILESSNRNLNVGHEFFVDVFPLDTLPSNPKDLKHQSRMLKKYKFLIYGKLRVPSKNKTLGLIKRIISFLYPNNVQKLKGKYQIESQKYNLTSKSKLYFVTGSSYEYCKEIIPFEDLDNRKKVKFEDIELFIIDNFDCYLTRLYGNYLILPPLNERYNFKHKFIRICFDDNEY